MPLYCRHPSTRIYTALPPSAQWCRGSSRPEHRDCTDAARGALAGRDGGAAIGFCRDQDPAYLRKQLEVSETRLHQSRRQVSGPLVVADNSECYYRHALRAYARVQRFTPSIEDRGVAYESFVLMGTTHWDPHR